MSGSPKPGPILSTQKVYIPREQEIMDYRFFLFDWFLQKNSAKLVNKTSFLVKTPIV
jgi:hypothetical protein